MKIRILGKEKKFLSNSIILKLTKKHGIVTQLNDYLEDEENAKK